MRSQFNCNAEKLLELAQELYGWQRLKSGDDKTKFKECLSRFVDGIYSGGYCNLYTSSLKWVTIASIISFGRKNGISLEDWKSAIGNI